MFFCLFAKLLDNIYVSITYSYFLCAQEKTGREKAFSVVLWSLFTSVDLLPSVSSSLLLGDLLQ